MNADTSQPHTAPPVPEYPSEYAIVDATDGSRPSTEKETEKDSSQVKSRLNSCFCQHLKTCIGKIRNGGDKEGEKYARASTSIE